MVPKNLSVSCRLFYYSVSEGAKPQEGQEICVPVLSEVENGLSRIVQNDHKKICAAESHGTDTFQGSMAYKAFGAESGKAVGKIRNGKQEV